MCLFKKRNKKRKFVLHENFFYYYFKLADAQEIPFHTTRSQIQLQKKIIKSKDVKENNVFFDLRESNPNP